MRVVTWNMGMADRRFQRPGVHDQAWHFLLGLGPDIALVQETLPPAWVRQHATVVQGPFKRFGTAIVAPRYPIERIAPPKGSLLRTLGSYLAFGTVSLPDGTDVLVGSVHAVDKLATAAHLAGRDPSTIAAPLSRTRPKIKDLVFVGISEMLEAGTSFIMAGDWNAARSADARYGADRGGPFFERAHEARWYDCVWESQHGELQTWFREGDRVRQNDHVFCDMNLGERLTSTDSAPEAVERLGLSDHAPLIADFNIEPISMTTFGFSH